METTQRWRHGRDYHRARGEAFHASEYGVEPIPEASARAFVTEHHYSGSWPSARCRVGLFHRSVLVGVAVFSVGVQRAAVPSWAPGTLPEHGVDLGRFVLLDECPYNAETWFLARSFATLRAELPEIQVVLSYSDPMPRTTEAGHVVMPGHVGVIYQAKGARYVGRTRPERVHLDKWGRVLPRRSLSKLRNDEVGADGVERMLVERGAPVRAVREDRSAWLARALREGPFREARHPGQHVYLFDPRGGSQALPAGARQGLSYPKKDDVSATGLR